MLWIGTKTKSKTLEIVKSLRILDPRNNFYKSQKVDLLWKIQSQVSSKIRRMRILRLLKHCEYDTIPQNGLKLTIKSHYVLEIGQPCLQQKSHFTLKQQFYWNTRFRPNGVPRLQPPIGIRRATSQHRWLGLPSLLVSGSWHLGLSQLAAASQALQTSVHTIFHPKHLGMSVLQSA